MKDFAPVGTDKAKRTTLKLLSALAATAGLVGNTYTNAANDATNDTDASMPVLDVYTRISATTNDLEVVIANVGSSDADIHQLTPGETRTRRGRFDFRSVTNDKGYLYLAAGASVTVPMKHHAVVLDGSELPERARSITDTLKRGVTARLADGQFAPLRVRGFSTMV